MEDIADQGKVIELAYVIQNQDGVVLESREESRPAKFVFGNGQVLPAIEQAIEGRGKGFVKKLVVPESLAFGAYDLNLITKVHRSALPDVSPMRVGTKFKTYGPDGKKLVIRVIGIEGDYVKLDGNHPLAGNDLHIDLRVLSVRESTESERGGKNIDEKNQKASSKKQVLH